jgi:hypothetical protein
MHAKHWLENKVKRSLGRPRHRLEDKIRMDLTEKG